MKIQNPLMDYLMPSRVSLLITENDVCCWKYTLGTYECLGAIWPRFLSKTCFHPIIEFGREVQKFWIWILILMKNMSLLIWIFLFVKMFIPKNIMKMGYNNYYNLEITKITMLSSVLSQSQNKLPVWCWFKFN